MPNEVSSDSKFVRPPRTGRLELLTLVHVGVLVVGAAWWFGGNADPAQIGLAAWGSLAPVITFAALRRRHGVDLRPLRWLWPFGLFVLLVIASTFNPSFREIQDGPKSYFVETGGNPHWPGSAWPRQTWRALWFFSAIYWSCFNVFLTVRRRRALRVLLLALAANAGLLAIYGTVQKLLHAQEIFFLPGKAVQPYFFSSFIYHNHWGAFTVLMTAIFLGLAFHFWRRRAGRDVWHSPVPAMIVGVMLLAVTEPLSGSRSCTILVTLLLGGAFLHWLVSLVRQPSGSRAGLALRVAGGLLVAAALAGFAYDLARPMIERRVSNTLQQIDDARRNPGPDSRLLLYRDTWHMAQERLWFGWGMASYPTVFYFRNTQRIRPDGLQLHFHDAHSDWLQSPSEVGLIGTGLLALCGLVPLWTTRRALGHSIISNYLLAGCTIVLLYAWLEFPFGNRAVVCAWWLSFAVAVHYARLSQSLNADSSPLASEA